MIPSAPRTTFSTSGVSFTQTKTKSDAAAASLGVLAHLAPRESNSSDLDFVRELTTNEFPAASRCPAMGPPMIPVPINAAFAAIRSLSGLPELRESLVFCGHHHDQ